MDLRIALAGNPNCGKTTLFNALTGSNQFVGNWPGVTVEKKEGKLKKHNGVIITDLPGIYSLSPYTLEEVVARNYLLDERPDVILNVVDGTNLERNLYLTTQLVELGIPVVIAINMMDVVRKNGDKINIAELSKELGCKVVEISALKGDGIMQAADAAIEAAKNGVTVPQHTFSGVVEHAIAHIEEAAVHNMPEEQQRWYAIKIFERDDEVLSRLSLNKNVLEHIENDIKAAESELDDDAESIITNERYIYIASIIKGCYKKRSAGRLTTSDKIDKVLTNRIIAIPAFLAIMYGLFKITFGEGPLGLGVWLQTIVGDFWDGPLTETILTSLQNMGASEWALSLVGDGILAGLGGVVSFLPQILVLFLLMSILEDSGYMARVAFVMDKLFRRFGLSGKSFIPLLMGFGCSVPALMASRTLENEKDRKITMMITPFMSCGAKLPIYLMFAATLFANNNQTLIIYSIYMLGLVVAVISALILSKFVIKGEASNFIMELPQYRIPTLKSVFIHALEKVKGFAIKAGTIILGSTILIWFLSNFNLGGMCEMEDSILATIGRSIQWIFAPLGFGNWKASVAVVTGWIAKENIVSTFGVLYGASDAIAEAAMEGSAAIPGVAAAFTKASAFAYMAFNLLCMPCFAAVGAIKKEMGNWKDTLKTIGFQMLVAWIVAFIVYIICGFIF